MDVKSFVKAARLRTLPLSVSGIIVGSFLGLLDKVNNAQSMSFIFLEKMYPWETLTFWLAILTTIGFQVLSNFANDYGDGIKGTDNIREGEARMVSSGKITPKQMKNAMMVTTIITLIVAMLLIYVSFGKENFAYSILFFGLGIASIVAAIKYTVGNAAYGYSGFGDVFVFLFFGLVSVVGSYFLFTKDISFIIFLPAFAIGLLSTSVLNLNNMRDRVNDKMANKNTLVVKIGASSAKRYHYFLILTSLVISLVFVAVTFKSYFQFLFLIAYIPLVKHLIFVKNNQQEKLFDGELKKVALSTFLFAILLGMGQIL